MSDNPFTPPNAPLEVATPADTRNRGLRVAHVARDVIILLVLTGLGGFVIGIAIGTAGVQEFTPQVIAAISLSNFLLSAVAFFIGGILTRVNRPLHLAVVAFISWLLSLLNVVVMGITIIDWLFAGISLALAMLLGWGASALLTRNRKDNA